MRNFELNEGLIKVPTAVYKRFVTFTVRQIIWRSWSKWTSILKKSHNDEYLKFIELALSYGVEIPRTQWKMPDDNYEYFQVPLTTEGMPPNYPRLSEPPHIAFVLNWGNDNIPGADPRTRAAWNMTNKMLILNIYNYAGIMGFPADSDTDSLRYDIEEVKENIVHELRHAVQDIILGAHPDQKAMKADYDDYGTGYYQSKVEFDPTIGSAVKDFVTKWKLVQSAYADKGYDFKVSVRKYLALTPSSELDPFAGHELFKALMKEPTLRRYKLAVKKFHIELQNLLKDEKLKEDYSYATSNTMPGFDTCAIQTAAFLIGKDNNTVWKMARRFWRPKRGMDSLQCSRMFNAFGFQFGAPRYDLVQKAPTLGALYGLLRREPPQKSFWITVPDHAIGFHAGNILDVANKPPGTKVLAVYEVVHLGAFREDEDDVMARLKNIAPEYRLPALHKLLPSAKKYAPDEMVTIYRGVPEDVSEIVPGDWVVIDKKYADNEGIEDRVLKKQVPASHVAWAGTDMHEYFYAPPLEDPDDGAKKNVINEVKRDTPWFHGTNSLARLKGIAAKGLVPGRSSNYKGAMETAEGRVYLTSEYFTAMDYSFRSNKSDYLYVAQFDLPEQVEPDEDDIIMMVKHVVEFFDLSVPNSRARPETLPFWKFVRANCKDAELVEFQRQTGDRKGRGMYITAKRLQNAMPPEIADIVLNNAWKAAHKGVIKPTACWVIKKDTKGIAHDGSNLPELATRLEDFLRGV